jgi:hypothetical protein
MRPATRLSALALACALMTASTQAAAWVAPRPAAPSATAPAATAPPAPTARGPVVLAQVVVSGQRPGPGLWKVSRGDHALWILGTVSPVPREMEWYSPRSEAVLRQAREIIEVPRTGAYIGWGSAFKLAFAMPAILRARQLPDGKTLRQVLPPDLYARWQQLQAKYPTGDKDVERWRPMFAADRLYAAALASAGLRTGNGTDQRIAKLADQYDIKRTANSVGRKISNPRQLAKSFAKADIDEVACFRGVLDRLDFDVAQAALRANAWAVGNLPELKRLVRHDQRDPCLEALQATQAVQDLGLADAPAQARNKWLSSVAAALAANDVSFGTLPMHELLDADGLLALLRAQGYQVVEPG